MRSLYRYLLAMAAFTTLAWSQEASAQLFTECPDNQDECLVEWDVDGDFLPDVNALRNTIVNDATGDGNVRPEGRVYVLRRGGLYYNEDVINNDGWTLRLVGQTADQSRPEDNVCGPNNNEDCGPALLQRFRGEDDAPAGMISSDGDANAGLVLRNLWLMGQDDAGVTSYYEPIVINSSNARFEFDHVVFDRNDWHHISFKSGGNSIYIRNSRFRNLVGPTQRYEGRAIRLEAGADTLVMENNTIFNMTMTPVQSEAEPIDYFLFNHNTLVNFGMWFNAGGIWQKAYVTNNLLVNPFWQGESADIYNQPDRDDPYSGVFTVAPLPVRFGLETDRRIVLANNAYWRDPAIEAYYQTFNPIVRAQPLVNDTTQAFFDLYEGMVIEDNINLAPDFANAPLGGAVYDSMFAFIQGVSVDQDGSYPYVIWDPGRQDNPLANNFPTPEDFSYTTQTLRTHGTDDLPLGDLNWFPDAKQTYLANREAYVEVIEEMAGGEPVPPIANPLIAAESGTLSDAEIGAVEGRTSFFLEGSGSIRWTFEVPSDGEYGLNVVTNLRNETERGQHLRLDGVGLRNATNFGEYFYCSTASTNAQCTTSLQPNTFETVEVRQSGLIAEQSTALTLTAGAHTLEIAPSWGWQEFSTVTVVDAAGNPVAELTPPEATTVGAQEICEAGAFCAQGFQWVSLNPGGRVSWTVDFPATAAYVLPQFFVRSAGGGSGEILLDGQKVADVTFPATDAAATTATNVTAPQFDVSAGTHTVTLLSSTGGVDVDYAIFLIYGGGDVGTERDELPEGYALGQNYPNPFNPVTSIQYEVPSVGHVSLKVYDVLGRQVMTLVDGQVTAGRHTVRLDGSRLSSGVYFYRLQTAVGQQVRTMVLMK